MESRMAMISGALYQALRAAGVPADQALLAAEEVAAIRMGFDETSGPFASIRARLDQLIWMMAILIVLSIVQLGVVVTWLWRT